MNNCLQCNGQAAYDFRVLEVHTLHVRDLTGEKRVQALGSFQNFAVCEECAENYLANTVNPVRPAAKRCIIYIFLLLLGGVLTGIFAFTNGALRLMGLAAIICGMLGLISVIHTAMKRRAEYMALPKEKALYLSAWKCMLKAAPKKAGENDLTYIPVDSRTIEMKNGDLAIVYNLLPAVAIKAHQLIHETEPQQ